MGRAEGKPHRSEVLGWLRLSHLQRAVRQRAEHPDAEKLPRGTAEAAGRTCQRPGTNLLRKKYGGRDAMQTAGLTEVKSE